MPLDQRIRQLGAPLYRLFKKKGLSSSGKQSYVVRSNPRAVKVSNVDREPSATPPSSLPVELWMKIIHELGHGEWIALCQVCWLLYQIAQPCLYENITLGVWELEDHRRDISNGQLSYSHPRFKRTIDGRSELGAYVCNLDLKVPIELTWPNPKKRYPLLFELFLFPNLESLEVDNIHFDIELCNILHSHPRLKSVTLLKCTLDESLAIARIDEDHFPRSSISKLELLWPMDNPLIQGWAALAPAKLESLAVGSVVSPELDAGLILNRIGELNKTRFLTTLSLNFFSPAVVRFLIASPQLRHFILTTWVDEHEFVSSSLPANAIPFLEEYNGPAEISSTFIRGRPVHTVKFLFFDSIPEDRLGEMLIPLQYSTVPLTSLQFSLPSATVGSWLSHIPVTVRYLRLDYIHRRDFEKCLPALSHLTSLRTLSGKYGWTRQERLHRDDIIQISNTCQSLREIDIGPQKWCILGNRVWEPFSVFLN